MASASLTDTHGVLALVALGLAALGLIVCATLVLSVRRIRAAQRDVLGPSGTRDLVEHASTLQDAFEDLREYVGEVAERIAAVELALRGAVAYYALVRYDAYNELSGRQSMSIALLDESRSGIVLSSIHHRDQARLYAKEVQGGEASDPGLSPEEAEAVRLAIEAPRPDALAGASERPR
ncbi:MAG TPA: DUF4446 family protein [Solirubrobacteraceae bacterium]|jgi:hypothetical protein|nr:DUF4446 family protein [Solirubrobacteraceae bacterium]